MIGLSFYQPGQDVPCRGDRAVVRVFAGMLSMAVHTSITSQEILCAQYGILTFNFGMSSMQA